MLRVEGFFVLHFFLGGGVFFKENWRRGSCGLGRYVNFGGDLVLVMDCAAPAML